MKFVMDERLKHRLTGVVVVVSMAVVFLPAMMKQSNRHFEENINISLKLPTKPTPPKVTIPNQTAMLHSVKVAHVDIPNVIEQSRPSLIAKAEPLSKKPTAVIATLEPVVVKPVKLAPVKRNTVASVIAKNAYGIQLASFTQQRNAEYLVARLVKQGYVASYNKLKVKQGDFYQVVVGGINQKNEALNLQKKLATNMKLNGFIIKTGVS